LEHFLVSALVEKLPGYEPNDQLKDIYVGGELEPINTAQWYPKV
jgi:hypothetical protein